MSSNALKMAIAAVVGGGVALGGYFVYKKATMKKPKPLVITGPSGVGKGTLIRRLQEDFPYKVGFVVSHTTRDKRENNGVMEQNGKEYWFVTKDKFLEMIDNDEFIEHKTVHSGKRYGSSAKAVHEVMDQGKMCILDIDVQGAEEIKSKVGSGPDSAMPPTKFIFIEPPSIDELKARLRGRGSETSEQIEERIKNAVGEIESSKKDNMWDKVLVNDDLEKCYQDLLAELKSEIGEPQPKATQPKAWGESFAGMVNDVREAISPKRKSA